MLNYGYVSPMAKPEPTIPMELKEVIAANINRLAEKSDDKELRRATVLATKSGLGRKTINRLLKPEKYPKYAPNLQTLIALSGTLEADLWEFLLPRRQPTLTGVNHTKHQGNIPHESLRNRKLKGR